MLLTASAIAEKLADRAEEVVGMLLPGGKAHGNEWIADNGEIGPQRTTEATYSICGVWSGESPPETLYAKARRLWAYLIR